MSALAQARSVSDAERLLASGADAAEAGDWWASGFGTENVLPEVAEFLVERGAGLTAHAASGLGLTDRLRAMLAKDRGMVHAKGGDGCTPLHFARDLEIARLLLESGADVNARDDDHDSTPAQWIIGRNRDVAQFLLDHGAAPDLFLAVALGNRALVEQLIAADPACVSHRIGKPPAFPPRGNGRGGTIYQWTLAFNSYSHQIALRTGHPELFDLLYENSDTATRLLVNCVLARRSEAEAIAATHPGLVAALPSEDHELLPRYCWETNTNYEAVKLMLDLGFPLTRIERSHGYSPLHNAAWAGSADLVELLIERGHPVNMRDPVYDGTPLNWALQCRFVEKRHPEGQYGRVVRALVMAGSPLDGVPFPTGDDAIDDALKGRF